MSVLYFETSAFVKLLVSEAGSEVAKRAWHGAMRVTSSRLLLVEARASLAAAYRGRRMDAESFAIAKRRLAAMRADIDRLQVDAMVLAQAERLTEREALRGYDAVHLASALDAEADVLITADADLLEAARRRGLAVIDARD